MRRAMAQARSKFPSDAAPETAPSGATVSLTTGSAAGHSSSTDLRTVDPTAAHWSQPFACDVHEPFGD